LSGAACVQAGAAAYKIYTRGLSIGKKTTECAEERFAFVQNALHAGRLAKVILVHIPKHRSQIDPPYYPNSIITFATILYKGVAAVKDEYI
jgi:hypothetical protein